MLVFVRYRFVDLSLLYLVIFAFKLLLKDSSKRNRHENRLTKSNVVQHAEQTKRVRVHVSKRNTKKIRYVTKIHARNSQGKKNERERENCRKTRHQCISSCMTLNCNCYRYHYDDMRIIKAIYKKENSRILQP